MSGKKLQVVLATRNKGKIRELAEPLAEMGVEVLGLDRFPGIGEIPENGSTFAENALVKAGTVADYTGLISVADDSGLEVDALGGRLDAEQLGQLRTGRGRNTGDAVHFRDRCAHHGGNDVLRDIDAALFILASNIIFRHRKIPPDKIVQYSVPRAAAKRKKNVSRPAKRCTP